MSPIEHTLYRAMRDYKRIHHAAEACFINHRYPDFVNNREPVPFFDFDFICATLRVICAATLVERESTESEMVPLGSFFGPHTVRQFVRRIHKYTLPFGAEHELLRRKQILNTNLSTAALTALERYDKACKMDNPVHELWNLKDPRDLSQTVLNELDQICGTYDDVGFLDSVLKRAIPVHSLAGKEPDVVNEAYDLAYKALSNSRRRPDRATSNVNDAINIAVLVWVYRSPATSQSKPPMPFMVSDTPSLSDFASLQRRLFLPIQDELCLFTSREYLFISDYLHNYSGERIGIITAESHLLAHEAEIVIQAIDRVLMAIKTRRVSPDATDSPEWHLLRNVSCRFHSKWSQLLDPGTRCAEHDFASLRNVLLAPELKQALEQAVGTNSHKEIKTALKRVYDLLRTTTEEDKQLRELLLRPVHLANLDSSHRAKSLYQFTVVRSDESVKYSMLSSVEGVELEDAIQQGWRPDAGGHIVVSRRFMPNCSPVLAIDFAAVTDNLNRDQTLCFRWEHVCSALDLWTAGLALLHGVTAEDNGLYHYRLCSPGLEPEKTGTIQALKDNKAPTTVSFSNVDHFEIAKDKCAWCVDVEPRNESELQASVVFTYSMLSTQLLQAVARTIAETNRHELNTADFNDIIQHIILAVFTINNVE